MKPKIGFGVVSLYLLVLYFLNAFRLVLWMSNPSDSDWLELTANIIFILASAAYISLAILIWLEIEQLAAYHIDRISLLLLVVFGPLLRTNPRPNNEIVFLIIIWISCIIIAIAIIRNWSKIPKTNLNWSAKGLFLTGLVLLIIIAVESYQPEVYSRADPSTYNPILDIIRRTISDLSSTSTIEEIIFRGFLWGYFTQLGWSEKRVFWTQGVLFWLAHFSGRLGTPITFFITIPITTIVFSELARNTKQVFWSILFHTISNTLGPVLLIIYYLDS